MLRELIEKEAATVRDAVHAVREWIHPTQVMKGDAFDRPLDDVGQTIDDVEDRAPARANRTARALADDEIDAHVEGMMVH